MTKNQEFIIESDSYYSVRTLEECKQCVYGEEDLYHIKDGCLYYGGQYIGAPK